MKSGISPETSLFEWFHQRIQDVHASTHSDLSNDTSLYLASLLAERARTDRQAEGEETLVELHARASNSPPPEAARRYRELGDRSLYVVGYFEESLSRSIVSPGYYCDMGSAAYARADQVFKRWFADAFGDLFGELAGRFRECVRLLREVRRTVDDEPELWMRLYQEWLETGSEETANLLRARGLVLPSRPLSPA